MPPTSPRQIPLGLVSVIPQGVVVVYPWGTLRSTPGERDSLPQGEALVYPKSVF